MTEIILSILLVGVVAASAWLSPRIFRISILTATPLIGFVGGVTIEILSAERPVLGLIGFSIGLLAVGFLVLRRRAVVFWAIVTAYMILVLPVDRGGVAFGLPAATVGLLVARRLCSRMGNGKKTDRGANQSLHAIGAGAPQHEG